MYEISFREFDNVVNFFRCYDSGLAYKFVQILADAYDRGDIAWFDFRSLEVSE